MAAPPCKMKYCVFQAKGDELYAGARVGGNTPAFWPRHVQSPIGDTPLTGSVGSFVAVPDGSVPAGKILPLTMNGSPRSPAKNPGDPVRQSHATSKIRTSTSSAAFATAGAAHGARPIRPITVHIQSAVLWRRVMCCSFREALAFPISLSAKTRRVLERPSQLAEQPRSGHPPVAGHGIGGHVENLRGLFDGQTGEELQLDHLHFACIEFGEAIQCAVERNEIDQRGIAGGDIGVERDVDGSGPALGRAMLADQFHQQPPHRSPGDREEMVPVLPVHLVRVGEPHECLVDQRGRLKRVAGARATDAALRFAPQFAVKDCGYLAICVLVPAVPGAQKLRDVAAGRALPVVHYEPPPRSAYGRLRRFTSEDRS